MKEKNIAHVISGAGRASFMRTAAMTVAAFVLGSSPIAQPMMGQAANASTINTEQNQKAPFVNPTVIREQKVTPIGTPIPRTKKRLFGSEPQKHAKRHTNTLHSRTKATNKAKRK
jgi:hypothetical protein